MERAVFPVARPRRLRRTEGLRRLVRETRLAVDRLIYPLFVVPGADVQAEIASLPGVYHWSVDLVADEARAVADDGVARADRMGARPLAWRLRAARAAALEALGRGEEAATERHAAAMIVRELAATIEDDALRCRFVAKPEVVAILGRCNPE